MALEPDGTVGWALGAIDEPIFARSANKPLQALAMLRTGLELDEKLLALVCASHSGEDFHTDGVRQILAGAGLDEEALRCPPDQPIDEASRAARLAAGHGPERVLMNCSGKHAGMLATCVAAGWATGGYRDPEHPLQLAIRATIEDLTAERVAHVGVDGCGAPLFSVSLRGLARAFQLLAAAEPGTSEYAVAAAMRAHPRLVSGTHRDEAKLFENTSGWFGKSGAEASYAVALPDRRVVALKIEDGAQRARPVVMAAALQRLGYREPVLEELATEPVFGGGDVVGEIRACL